MRRIVGLNRWREWWRRRRPPWRAGARAALGAAAAVTLVIVIVAASRAHFVDPAPTLLIRDRQGRFMGELGALPGGDCGYWPVDRLPPRAVAATLAIEDRRFYRHPGVDPLAVARSCAINIRHGRRVTGASTIAMQVARMQHPGARGYVRKATEALTALMLTARYGRDAILAQYVRLAPYGNRIHGIAFAARRYLDKPVDDLSWAETAFLAALPQAPGRMNPYDDAGKLRAVRRAGRILRALEASGQLTRAERELALGQLSELRLPKLPERPDASMHALLYVDEMLRAKPGRTASLKPADPLVTATIDLDLQAEVARLAREQVLSTEDRGAGNAAVIVLEMPSAEVLAWVGSTGYFDAKRAGAIDYARVLRSPGSTLKPFLYALALDRGIVTPGTTVDDLRSAAWGIVNADHVYLGPLLPRVALANSRNVPAANILNALGVPETFGAFRDLGLHDGEQTADRFGLGLAIGGMPTTLERLARAYTALAGDGTVREPAWLRAASPSPRQRGTTRGPAWSRSAPAAHGRRAFSEDAARQVTLFLSDPMARLPSFPRMGASEFPFPAAVKTGTSSGFVDAWAVLYTNRYVVAVWIGHPDARAMNHLTGFNSAARLGHAVLTHLHREEQQGLQNVSFPPPRGFRPARLCALTGITATQACERVHVEWFRPGEEPVSACRAHVRLAVDKRNGLLASRRTSRTFIEYRTFVHAEPRWAAWAVSAGLLPPPDQVSPLGADTVPATDLARLASPLRAPAADVVRRPGRSGSVSPVSPGRLVAGPGRPRSAGGAFSPAASDGVPPTVRITYPPNGARFMIDPEVPASLATLPLEAVVDPPARQVVWYVDGAPLQVVDFPYSARWSLASGPHTFEARLPYADAASTPVRILVQ